MNLFVVTELRCSEDVNRVCILILQIEDLLSVPGFTSTMFRKFCEVRTCVINL